MSEKSRTFNLGQLVGATVAALAAGFFLGGAFMQIRLDQSAPAVSAQAAAPQGDAPQGGSVPPGMATRIAKLERAAAAAPRDQHAWIGLGNACFDANLPRRAVAAYEKAAAIAPLNADVLTDLGVMRRRSGDAHGAVASFDAALKQNPRHQKALYDKGVVLLHDMGDDAGALAVWERLLAVNPDAKTPEGAPLRDMTAQLRRN